MPTYHSPGEPLNSPSAEPCPTVPSPLLRRPSVAALLRVPLYAVALLLASAASGDAQEDVQPAVDDTLQVEMTGGEGYVGRVVRATPDTIALETAAGARVTLARERLESVSQARGRFVGGEFWHEDPNRTRLFFSPTGRSLPSGGGYFGVYELFVPFVTVGLTDRLLLAGGSPFYLGMLTGEAPPVYFGPKVQVVDAPSFDGAVGGLTVILPEDGDGSLFGVVYGVGTVGSADHALTGGVGWGYVEDDFSSRPAVVLGGETRVSSSLKLITENVFVPGESGAILSAGVRFFGERLSADAGLIGVAGDGGECCFPMVNFVYNFGRQ